MNDTRIADKIIRYRVMDLHHSMVSAGQYHVARKVLHCLIDGYVTLGLDDISWTAETALESIGCRVWYSSSGRTSRVYCMK